MPCLDVTFVEGIGICISFSLVPVASTAFNFRALMSFYLPCNLSPPSILGYSLFLFSNTIPTSSSSASVSLLSLCPRHPAVLDFVSFCSHTTRIFFILKCPFDHHCWPQSTYGKILDSVSSFSPTVYPLYLRHSNACTSQLVKSCECIPRASLLIPVIHSDLHSQLHSRSASSYPLTPLCVHFMQFPSTSGHTSPLAFAH